MERRTELVVGLVLAVGAVACGSWLLALWSRFKQPHSRRIGFITIAVGLAIAPATLLVVLP